MTEDRARPSSVEIVVGLRRMAALPRLQGFDDDPPALLLAAAAAIVERDEALARAGITLDDEGSKP